MMGRPSTKIELDAEEEQVLRSLLRRRTTGQGIATRSRIVLACAEGLNNIAVAALRAVPSKTDTH